MNSKVVSLRWKPEERFPKFVFDAAELPPVTGLAVGIQCQRYALVKLTNGQRTQSTLTVDI